MDNNLNRRIFAFMEKIFAFIRWFFFAAILQIIIIPLAYVLYPFAYILKDFLRRNRPWTTPLWIFLDDEVVELSGDDYGELWWKQENGIVVEELNAWQKFIVAYRWGVIRNPAWNQYKLFKPKQGEIFIFSAKGKLTKNGVEVPLTDFATFKWENEAGQYTDNQGEYLSFKFSTLGKSFVWYRIYNTLYWRYSFAKKVKCLNRWVEVHLGTNNRRYTIRLKIKNPAKLRGFPSNQ